MSDCREPRAMCGRCWRTLQGPREPSRVEGSAPAPCVCCERETAEGIFVLAFEPGAEHAPGRMRDADPAEQILCLNAGHGVIGALVGVVRAAGVNAIGTGAAGGFVDLRVRYDFFVAPYDMPKPMARALLDAARAQIAEWIAEAERAPRDAPS